MLSAGRNTSEKQINFLLVLVAAQTIIYEGSLVVLEAGYAKPGKEATGLVCLGRAEEYVNNFAGQNGDKLVRVKRGCFKFENDSDNPVTGAHVLQDCFIVDDETVSSSDESSARSVAGKVIAIESDGVWVDMWESPDLVLYELAGVGRTTETVKGNADTIAAHAAKRHVFNAVATASLAEINAGKAIIPGVIGKKIVPLNYSLRVIGPFAAGTNIKLQDSNDVPIVVCTALAAALTDGAKIGSQATVANVTDGAGFQGELTSGKSMNLVATGAFTGGTSIAISIDYALV